MCDRGRGLRRRTRVRLRLDDREGCSGDPGGWGRAWEKAITLADGVRLMAVEGDRSADFFWVWVSVFLLGFLGKLVFRCGVFVVRLWWIVWIRWFLEWLVLVDGFFADFWDLFLKGTSLRSVLERQIQGFFASLRMTT